MSFYTNDEFPPPPKHFVSSEQDIDDEWMIPLTEKQIDALIYRSLTPT